MAPIPIHALAAPAHPGWCTLFAPLCHQPSPKTGIFDVGYGGTLVSTPFTDSHAYHSGYNGSSAASALGVSEGIHAGASADQGRFSSLAKPADPVVSRGGNGSLTWRDGTDVTGAGQGGAAGLAGAAGRGEQGVARRGEALQAMAWAAAVAGTKYIIKETFKAGGRQIYKAFHEGDTEGLAGTMFEKAPYQPYSWEFQAIEDEKERAKAWEIIQREEAAAEERRKVEAGIQKRGEVEGEVRGEVEGEV